MNKTDLSGYTAEELKAALAAKEKAEQAARERARQSYELDRDNDLAILINRATSLSAALKEFKALTHEKIDNQALKLAEYGKIRSNSKGGLTIMDASGTVRIRRRRDTQPVWDERSEKGIELVKEFLFDKVKKYNKKIFEIMLSYISRNEKGDLEYAKIMILLQHEKKFSDPRWVEGLDLVKEGYSNILKGYQYDFEVLDSEGKWERLDLNFSAI